ncbi:Clan CA, family C40, NlpC/P60 superfamily cysteine peptidase [Trichomonas vaginalis G3]|uniref:Clan CA, family C40, NlpC/P60 superfamily cysteine peptidase n=1 Tax=Trichomonas vaginalis (strain ATCC PRA-98 / G3) TaxID=412133 RepID=A2EER0_TRIV3|nr:peptidoglycan DL-endopeptidase CWLO family [Trichomonas vaginalis G3]EAY08866.1 Clan CA, family C40, NlpC/P60 superfamily cysteine peptidase [Trichomonas vaginalis G3]KAI5489361.1 peptidoglycan DL-endopeptidase CWLO family [Trichomonas vaginalis G3]|eukprot:XP_001321089.1 Clan CA, family C40, NlpC/P60 superfamily cysteine peptidase [Trichomonas vaginalis G3]
MFTILFSVAECGRHRHRNVEEKPVANTRGDDIWNVACSRLGCPYVWGATGPNQFDCSGLTQWAHRQVGINIPRVTYDQVRGGFETNGMRGDICCFYEPCSHVGICDGVGNYIHAPHSGDVVRISNYWVNVKQFRRYW